jgi:hypothetical protein
MLLSKQKSKNYCSTFRHAIQYVYYNFTKF